MVRTAGALGTSVIVLVFSIFVWSGVTQAPIGRWSLHTTSEVALLYALAFTIAIACISLPAFLLLGRFGMLSRLAASVYAGALLSSVAAVATYGWFFTIDGGSPTTVGAWIQHWPLLPPFALAGGMFGFVWSKLPGLKSV